MMAVDEKTPKEDEPEPLGPDDELWDADPACDHRVIPARGGGMRCVRCPGWFCY